MELNDNQKKAVLDEHNACLVRANDRSDLYK